MRHRIFSAGLAAVIAASAVFAAAPSAGAEEAGPFEIVSEEPGAAGTSEQSKEESPTGKTQLENESTAAEEEQSIVPAAEAGAQEVIAESKTSGSLNEQIRWRIKEGTTGKVLTIWGKGAIPDYAFAGANMDQAMTADHAVAPWAWCRNEIIKVVIKNGITSIGTWAFEGCGNLKKIWLPATIESYSDHSFARVPKVIYYKGSISEWEEIEVLEASPAKGAADTCILPESRLYFDYKKELSEDLSYTVKGKIGKAVLTITGTGDCPDYAKDSEVPWKEWRTIVEQMVISDNITSVGDRSGYKFSTMKSISVPASLTDFGSQTFRGCTLLTDIIYRYPESEKTVKVEPQSFYIPYDPYQAAQPYAEVMIDDQELYEEEDYEISYQSDQTAGDAQGIITFMGPYASYGEIVFPFFYVFSSQVKGEETPELKYCTLNASVFVYTGKEIHPSIASVRDNKLKLVDPSQYIVRYVGGCKKPGLYCVSLIGKGVYKNSIKKRITSFTIIKAPLGVPRITSISKSGSKVILKWKKVANASGYKIYRKAGSGGYRLFKDSYSGTTFTDTCTKKGKKYYYMVAARGDGYYKDGNRSQPVSIKL